MHQSHEFEQTIRRFQGQPILVLGDVMLDRYWWGTVDRISPEAPVPVVRKQRHSVAPGGAANTAANLVALGARPLLAGLIGCDEAAAELRSSLAEKQIDCSLLLADPDRPTTVKTRIVAHDQHVVRVDEEDTSPLSDARCEELAASLAAALSSVEAVVVSDYGKGFLTPRILAILMESARIAGKPVLIDPKVSDWSRYAGAAVVKPNRSELAALTGLPARTHEETVQAARRLISLLAGSAVLVTEGKEGMTLLEPGKPEHQLPTFARQVYDVTGAGDTVIATLAMALAAGASLPESAWLANVAAGIVVGEVGTAAVSREKLIAALDERHFPALDPSDAAR